MASAAPASSANPFNARTILLAIAAGVLAFAGFLVLTAYAPEWRMKTDAGAHALSKSAIGYAGFAELARKSGRPVEIESDPSHWYQEGFVLVPLDINTDAKMLADLVNARRSVATAVTLYVLPKWVVARDPAKPKWVRSAGTIDPMFIKDLAQILKSATIVDAKGRPGVIRGEDGTPLAGLSVRQPPNPRVLEGSIDPALVDSAGRIVMGRIENESGAVDYVLAEPDLLNNQGIKTKDNAAAALAIIDAMRNETNDSIAFDMVLASGGDKRNLLRLMFEPPFLAFTLALLVAALLIGVHAIGRFGPPLAEGRALAFGKRALVDSAATLIARAKRERALGERYVASVRDSAGVALGGRARDPQELETWLDTLPGGFAERAAAVREAKTATALRNAAANLHQWKKDLVRDR